MFKLWQRKYDRVFEYLYTFKNINRPVLAIPIRSGLVDISVKLVLSVPVPKISN